VDNYRKELRSINSDYTSLYFAMYMAGEWGVKVGYDPVSYYAINRKKVLADWQKESDCQNTLCKIAQNTIVNIIAYPVYGGSPFPQVDSAYESKGCYNPIQNVNLQSVQVVLPSPNTPVSSLIIEQFTVGNVGGPINGSSTFLPINSTTGLPLLEGKSVSIELSGYGPLTNTVDYSFNSTTGGITLLGGRLFNTTETYTITAY
jgi:hypothetical protein